MTTPRSKSPKLQNSFKKDDNKDETTFWDKIGTLGRKKRIKEGRHFDITIYGHHNICRLMFIELCEPFQCPIKPKLSLQYKKSKKRVNMLLTRQAIRLWPKFLLKNIHWVPSKF